MAKKTTAATQKAQDNADAIRKSWQQGRASQKRLDKLARTEPDALKHGNKAETFQQEADRLHTNIDTAKKMRRLAEEYTADQIDKVCELVVQHSSPFSSTHLLILLRDENRKQRDTLTKKAIREGWGTSRLERAIQASKGGRKKNVGRKPKVPADPIEALLALQAQCHKFNSWCAVALGILPKEVHPAINTATGAIKEVQTAVDEQLEATDKGRKKA